MSRKDYLKIFFEADEAEYEREDRRYCLPNIYNSNDYNIEIENKVYGLPDNNLGMNAKKPFLSVKSRKYPASYLLDGSQVVVQKQFFDYLMNLVSAGKYHVYIDTQEQKIIGCKNGEVPERVESGYYLRLLKGKTEAEIHSQDNISGYKNELPKPFAFNNMMSASHEKNKDRLDKYMTTYRKRLEIGAIINEVFFSNYLSGRFYTSNQCGFQRMTKRVRLV